MTGTRHRPRRAPRKRGAWRQYVGRVAAGVALVAVGGYMVVDDQVARACQADTNDALQANLSVRADLVEKERGVDRALVTQLVELPDTAYAQRKAARTDWLIASERIARDRAARPYEPVGRCDK